MRIALDKATETFARGTAHVCVGPPFQQQRFDVIDLCYQDRPRLEDISGSVVSCAVGWQAKHSVSPSHPPAMSRLHLGLLAGAVYGALSAASMAPLQFPDKRAALLGAFLNRFAIGLIIGAVIGAPQVDALRLPPWLIGLVTGVVLSAADAVITKAYAPIMVFGALGGAVIGWLVGRFGR